jgi:hypothetical protein
MGVGEGTPVTEEYKERGNRSAPLDTHTLDRVRVGADLPGRPAGGSEDPPLRVPGT